MKIAVDGKIIDCEYFLKLNELHKKLLKLLKKPRTQGELLKHFRVAQSTLSRNLDQLYKAKLITYKMLNGRKKIWMRK